mmetsp:Transcript_7980/g.17308  ORF Transcript_7980/g.17308 Transcript_7980/m.17308 type:complete len:315 (+) Transcript_7980:97-1041(+)
MGRMMPLPRHRLHETKSAGFLKHGKDDRSRPRQGVHLVARSGMNQAVAPIPYGRYDWPRLRQSVNLVPRPGVKQAAGSCTGATLACASVKDWLQPQCEHYSGLYVPRHRIWDDIQHHVDFLAISGTLNPEGALEEVVNLASTRRAEQGLAIELSERAQRLVRQLMASGMPTAVLQKIKEDIEEIGPVLVRMCPNAEQLVMKLEVMGENVCRRWHQDHYVGRAIVSYNGCGTVHTHNDNVDFWELENCGNNDHIIRDKSQVFSVDIMDILFIKGKLFPSTVKGLVHKSPEKRYHANGAIMNRLCLKVDIPAPVGR